MKFKKKMGRFLFILIIIQSLFVTSYAQEDHSFSAKLKITNADGVETSKFNIGDIINIDVILNETNKKDYLMYAAQFEVTFNNAYASKVAVEAKADGFQTGSRENKGIFAYLSMDNKGVTRPSELQIGRLQIKAEKDASFNIGLENVKISDQDTNLRPTIVESAKTIKIGTGEAIVDRQTLKSKILLANETKKDITVSADGKDVSTSAKWVTQLELDAFNTVINQGVKVYNDPESTQQGLEAAEKDLDEAITKFKALVKEGRKPSGNGGGGNGSGSTATTYTIKLETNGGSAVPEMTVNKNGVIATIGKTTKVGYTFDGWYTDSLFKNQFRITTPIEKDMTLYAKWIKNPAIDPGEKEWKNPFHDVNEKDWFYESVQFVNSKGLMNGIDKNTFAPKANITRGMFVTILYRMEEEPATALSSFVDVDPNGYDAKAIAWANEKNIAKGISNTKFAPNENLTREQMTTILYRYASYKAYNTKEKATMLSFTDGNKVSDYAKDGMEWAIENKLIQGKNTNLIDPQGNTTRAEMSVIFQRFSRNVVK